MLVDSKIWFANDEKGQPVYLLPQMAIRHGLVAGATGTGKTVTLKVLAESFSEMGVPVFMADVKGDIASLACPGTDSEDMQKRIERFGLASRGFSYQGYPVQLWDLEGKMGIPLRTTVSEFGPVLMARVLDLNDLQTDILNILFRIADDQKLLLIDLKDLKAMLNYITDNAADFQADYGRISSASTGAIMRAVVALESEGGADFFGDPGLSITDWLTLGEGGRGMINILDSQSLINHPRLYSTFLLWMLSELFETLPEVGDMAKPKLVFFFDEAHLLFNDTPKALMEKIEQVVKLVRSKGVGVYFCTQNPSDIPDGVLAQLNNKIQHGLRAYTPKEQKAVRAAADSYRANPEFDTYQTLLSLGTGEAVVSLLDEKGIPSVAQHVSVLPPRSRFGTITDAERDQLIKGSLLYSKYAQAQDPDSAYEFLQRMNAANEQKKAEDAQKAAEEKAAAKEQAAQQKEAERQAKAKEREKEQAEKRQKNAYKSAARSVSSTVAGTVGRQLGRAAGSSFGSFGKQLGGNLGASLGRGIIGTLFKK